MESTPQSNYCFCLGSNQQRACAANQNKTRSCVHNLFDNSRVIFDGSQPDLIRFRYDFLNTIDVCGLISFEYIRAPKIASSTWEANLFPSAMAKVNVDVDAMMRNNANDLCFLSLPAQSSTVALFRVHSLHDIISDCQIVGWKLRHFYCVHPSPSHLDGHPSWNFVNYHNINLTIRRCHIDVNYLIFCRLEWRCSKNNLMMIEPVQERFNLI